MSAFSTVPPTLHFLMLGAVSTGALYNLWVWLHRRRDTLHLWAAGWCAVTGAYLVSRYVQISAATPARVALGARLTWMSALLLIPVLIGLTQTLAHRRSSWRAIFLLGGLSAVLLPLVAFTNLVVTDQVYLQTDLLGHTYLAAVPGPLMDDLIPWVFGVFMYCFALVWRAKELDQSDRRVFLVGFAIYVAFAINDILHAARLIQSVRVFDYAFVGVALGLTCLVVRRYTRLSESLEIEVAAQTRDLQTRQVHLGALVRAGQVVMGGLDLQTVLARLIGEASRISGAPNTAVLLLDGGSRTLRLAAQVGNAYPPGHELQLGQGSSGLVAERGEPVFVPDVRDDPRSTIPDSDRASGIVTYLGLPIRAAGPVLGVLAFKTIVPPTALDHVRNFS